jgi:hypothetical protein
MGKKTVVMVACLVGIFAVALLRANQETDSKQDCGDVRISGGIGVGAPCRATRLRDGCAGVTTHHGDRY